MPARPKKTRGEILFEIDNEILLTNILSIQIQNKVYLEHIIDELYSKPKERQIVLESLQEKVFLARADEFARIRWASYQARQRSQK